MTEQGTVSYIEPEWHRGEPGKWKAKIKRLELGNRTAVLKVRRDDHRFVWAVELEGALVGTGQARTAAHARDSARRCAMDLTATLRPAPRRHQLPVQEKKEKARFTMRMLPLVALALLWANTGLMYAGNLRGTAGSTDLLLAVSTALIVTGGYFWYRTRNDVDLV
jgi:hypothetical protein